jgi:hypothetical protein
VALNESWDTNFGQGGVRNGPNIPFAVTAPGATVTFRYVAATHVLTVTSGHTRNNDVEWNGIKHDSRDALYRTPGGAVAAGTPVKLRLRTFHDDVTAVKLRLYDVNAAAQSLLPMTVAANDVLRLWRSNSLGMRSPATRHSTATRSTAAPPPAARPS